MCLIHLDPLHVASKEHRELLWLAAIYRGLVVGCGWLREINRVKPTYPWLSQVSVHVGRFPGVPIVHLSLMHSPDGCEAVVLGGELGSMGRACALCKPTYHAQSVSKCLGFKSSRKPSKLGRNSLPAQQTTLRHGGSHPRAKETGCRVRPISAEAFSCKSSTSCHTAKGIPSPSMPKDLVCDSVAGGHACYAPAGSQERFPFCIPALSRKQSPNS